MPSWRAGWNTGFIEVEPTQWAFLGDAAQYESLIFGWINHFARQLACVGVAHARIVISDCKRLRHTVRMSVFRVTVVPMIPANLSVRRHAFTVVEHPKREMHTTMQFLIQFVI